jgi:hypothetical protein
VELVALIVSAIGLLFAAIAAWGAVSTVQLTRQMQWDAAQSKLVEALVSTKYAALALDQSPNNPEALPRFRASQQGLDKAWRAAWRYVPGDDEVLEPLGELLRALPSEGYTPGAEFDVLTAGEAAAMAEDAITALTSVEFAKPPPMRWELIASLYRLRHWREARVP